MIRVTKEQCKHAIQAANLHSFLVTAYEDPLTGRCCPVGAIARSTGNKMNSMDVSGRVWRGFTRQPDLLELSNYYESNTRRYKRQRDRKAACLRFIDRKFPNTIEVDV